MKGDIYNENLDIQYVTDRDGKRVFVQIPVDQWEFIRTRLPEIAENESISMETAEAFERHGILVVRSKPIRDIADFVKEERERNLAEQIGKIWE